MDSLYLEQESFQSLLEASPTPTAIYSGTNRIILMANEPMLKLWGKDVSVIGKPLREALPELDGQPFHELLERVYNTGETYQAKEDLVRLFIDGQLQSFYFTFIYKALKNAAGETMAIINTATDVTELVLTRKQFAENQEYLSFALFSAEVGTWDLDPINSTVKWDARCRELFGFAKNSDTLYEEVLSCIYPGDKEMVRDAVAKAIDPHTNGEYDIRYRTVSQIDQQLRWLHCKGKAYFNMDGIAYRFAGTARDVTPEVTARRREQQMLTLVNNNADHMSIADMEGNLIYMNHAAKKMLGVDEFTEVSSLSASMFYTPEELERVQTQVVKEIHEYTGWQGTIRLMNCKTKEVIPCHVNYILIKDPQTGEVIGRGATARDLRPEIKARIELQRLATIVDISEDFCNYCDLEGNTIYMNEAGMQLIGMDKNHISSGNMYDYHSTSSSMLIRDEIVPQLLHTGKWSGPLELKHQYTGEIIPIHKQFFLIRDGITDKPAAIAGIARDLRLELAARKQQNNFLGIASHELKTPVTSIKAYAQVMEMMFRRSGDDKNADLVAKMDKQVNRLNSLIGDLLDVTKLNTGRLQFNLEPFDFNQMVEEVTEDVQRTTGKHLIKKQLSFQGLVTGDRERICQVVTNLLTNAIKYSPDADRIVVYTEGPEGHVQLCVQDFGIGLSRDKKDKVFEQFYRVSGNKEHTFPGLGLGLYISSEIVKRLGGNIWVNSVEGKGSTFCFSIPVVPQTIEN